jgi:Tol biopolymer transport system component
VGIGTPEYMAPEQGMGEKIDHRADIYALGVVLYELVTGRKPYQADTPMAVMIKKVTDPLPRPKQFIPSLPDAVENVLLKALAKDPRDRYSGMDLFAKGLENLSVPERVRVEEKPTVVAPVEKTVLVPPAEPPPARKKFTWWPWAAGCGAVVCLAVVIAGILWVTRGGFPLTGTKATQQATSTTSAQTPTKASSGQTEVPGVTSAPPPSDTPTPPPTGPQGKIVYTCQVKGEGLDQICLMNADGSNNSQLTNNNAENFYGSLSRDGRRIVFSSNQTGSFQIYEMDLRGNQTQLTYDLEGAYAPEISPDGSLIVFTRDVGSFQSVWVMNRDGSGLYELFNIPGADSLDPSWSADGSRVLLASGTDYDKALYIVNRDGSNAYPINTTFRTRGRSDWSPDGLLISAYAKLSNGLRGISIMNLDGSGLYQVPLGGDVVAPSFSPDSRWITFMGYIDNPGNTEGCEIYISRLDGSQLKRLTNNSYCDYQPRWGP